jgi:cytochrome c553
MDRRLFLKTMQDFKQGDRPATVMTRIAKGLTDRDLVKLADHFCKEL